MKPGWSASRRVNLLYVSTSLLWWQAVAGRIGVKSSNALRSNSRRTWQHGKGSRNVHGTAIRRALSSSHQGGRITAGVHGYPRGGASIRHHTASRVIPGPHTGGETTQSLHIPRDAIPTRVSSFRLLSMASPQLDTRWKLLI